MEMDLTAVPWGAAYLWGVPLILFAVMFHVSGLWLFTALSARFEDRWLRNGRSYPLFVLVLGAAVLLVTLLHLIEAIAWAGAYLALGAMANFQMAMLYSLNAITTFGHVQANLVEHWRFLGALEALNGMLLFGLTTAFLFAVAERVWPLGNSVLHVPRSHRPK